MAKGETFIHILHREKADKVENVLQYLEVKQLIEVKVGDGLLVNKFSTIYFKLVKHK